MYAIYFVQYSIMNIAKFSCRFRAYTVCHTTVYFIYGKDGESKLFSSVCESGQVCAAVCGVGEGRLHHREI